MRSANSRFVRFARNAKMGRSRDKSNGKKNKIRDLYQEDSESYNDYENYYDESEQEQETETNYEYSQTQDDQYGDDDYAESDYAAPDFIESSQPSRIAEPEHFSHQAGNRPILPSENREYKPTLPADFEKSVDTYESKSHKSIPAPKTVEIEQKAGIVDDMNDDSVSEPSSSLTSNIVNKLKSSFASCSPQKILGLFRYTAVPFVVSFRGVRNFTAWCLSRYSSWLNQFDNKQEEQEAGETNETIIVHHDKHEKIQSPKILRNEQRNAENTPLDELPIARLDFSPKKGGTVRSESEAETFEAKSSKVDSKKHISKPDEEFEDEFDDDDYEAAIRTARIKLIAVAAMVFLAVGLFFGYRYYYSSPLGNEVAQEKVDSDLSLPEETFKQPETINPQNPHDLPDISPAVSVPQPQYASPNAVSNVDAPDMPEIEDEEPDFANLDFDFHDANDVELGESEAEVSLNPIADLFDETQVDEMGDFSSPHSELSGSLSSHPSVENPEDDRVYADVGEDEEEDDLLAVDSSPYVAINNDSLIDAAPVETYPDEPAIALDLPEANDDGLPKPVEQPLRMAAAQPKLNLQSQNQVQPRDVLTGTTSGATITVPNETGIRLPIPSSATSETGLPKRSEPAVPFASNIPASALTFDSEDDSDTEMEPRPVLSQPQPKYAQPTADRTETAAQPTLGVENRRSSAPLFNPPGRGAAVSTFAAAGPTEPAKPRLSLGRSSSILRSRKGADDLSSGSLPESQNSERNVQIEVFDGMNNRSTTLTEAGQTLSTLSDRVAQNTANTSSNDFDVLSTPTDGIKYAKKRVYTIQEGDNLFNIAKNQLGTVSRWNDLYQLNRETIGNNFEYLTPGMQIVLPQ